jgi:hypothetical protein
MSRLPRLSQGQVTAVVIAVCAILGTTLAVLTRDEPGRLIAEGVELAQADPFAFEQEDAREFLERGSRGLSHPLFTLSPDGVEATAERTLRFEGRIADAAEREGVDPSTLEALVFLESAGRPDVIAGDSPESAAGLAQILPETATDLLDMSVDLERSKDLTREIARQEERASGAGGEQERREAERRIEALAAERRRVDERFDPEAALAGAARYLAIGEEQFGRPDLATASYHMGIGNLEAVIESYVAPEPTAGSAAETVARDDLSYAQLYFDSTPVLNPRTYQRLLELGDDSRHYLFRLEAARDVIRLYREDIGELRRLAELHGSKASREEVLRPPDETERFEEPGAVRAAFEEEELVPLKRDAAALGYRVSNEMGELAPRLDEEPSLYRGLRPEALGTVVQIAENVRQITGRQTMLTLTSSVRDSAYQDLLRASNSQAADEYSLHTTGYSFDIARDLPKRGEEALVAALERLRALNLLDWVYEPGAIHVTVGPDAEALLVD